MKRIFLLFLLLPILSLQAAPVRDRFVEAELVAQNTSIQPGRPFWVGVKLTMDEHWHTYWKNPGDSGLGTRVQWELPDGFSAGPIVWPHPHRIPMPPLVNYGYEGEVLLLTQITPPLEISQGHVTLRAAVNWLMCEEQCIPGKATVELSLPFNDAPLEPNTDNASLFETTFKSLPVDADGWTLRARHSGPLIELQATPPIEWPTGQTNLYFFADGDGVIEPSAPQLASWKDRTLTLTMTRAEAAADLPTRLSGVLVDAKKHAANDTPAAIALDTELVEGAFAATPAGGGSASMRLPIALGFAFLGGLILNLMPCVFPVLSLKLVHLLENAREERQSTFKHALVFTAGVLVSMWALAAILLALRAGGATAGWAFQLSNPTFVIALTFLFLLIALNMFGVFEIGMGLTRAGGLARDRSGLAGSFFSGLLTTIAGAPCAGPFLGTVIGYALIQPAGVAMLTFTAMGIGTAAPFAILSTNPALLNALPKAGPWMETTKQLMAFPMLATAGWFASVFVILQGGREAVFRTMIAFVLVGCAAWVFGKWTALHRKPSTRWFARFAVIALIALALNYALGKSELTVESWSQAKVENLRKAGKPIFVDFTAQWCAICQVNKRVALENPDVIATFKKKDITILVADWTDQNPEVTAGLAEFGRAAVPFYLLYGRDPSTPPTLLPELLTPHLLLEAVKDI